MKNVKESAGETGILNTFRFYQHNDPNHKSAIVGERLLYNRPKVIETSLYSPNLNGIENTWHELEIRFWQHYGANK